MKGRGGRFDVRDITHRRQRLDDLRGDLDAAWLAPVHDLEHIGNINAELRTLIGDDERASTPQPLSSKSALRDMIARAMANTAGAVPVRKIADNSVAAKVIAEPVATMNANHLPSAHQIATAIVYASREVDADPQSVAMDVTSRGGRDTELAHARAYAAFALIAVFPKASKSAIGRFVGSKVVTNYIALLEASRRRKQMRWWDERLFQRVVLRLSTTPREAKL